ncbi:MAG: TonB-dependent receptor, partial [Opitutaceae bacterium]|nr:TonB-dependent receptor [Opitutaceae bacterium]
PTSRQPDFTTLPASLFEEIEVIKAPTPEMRADSLGGNVNIKTVSLLKQRSRHISNYTLAFRWAPDFYNPVPMRAEHPVHPQFNFTHRQLFSVGGGGNNLALLIGGVYAENVMASYMMQAPYRSNFTAHEYEAAGAAGRAVPDDTGVYRFTQRDYYAMLQKYSANFKLEYALNPSASFYLSGIYIDVNYPGTKYNTLTLTTLDAAKYDPVTNTPTGGGHILPESTDKLTRVEQGSGSHNSILLSSNNLSYFDRQRKIEGGGKITLGNLDLDFNLNYSRRRYVNAPAGHYGTYGGGIVNMNIFNVGWTLDQRESDTHPKLAQNGGADWYNPDNYTSLRINHQDNISDLTDLYTAQASVRYRFPFSFPLSIKSGVWLNREERARDYGNSRLYSWVGVSSPRQFVDWKASTTASIDTGQFFPFVDPILVADDLLAHPEHWREDTYNNAVKTYQNTYGLTEDTAAGYVQAQFRIKGFRMLGGARYERTTDDVYGYLPSTQMSSAEERANDPMGAAARDYGNYHRNKGSYNDWFPSVHAVQKIGRAWQARLSWSNTMGRPPPSYLYPKETITDPGASSTGRITLNDPSIKPQYSENWDFALEYYSKRVGQFTVGVFRKNIKDFIYTGLVGYVGDGPDNGWNGDYAGYAIYRAANGGDAWVKGLEINYSQMLTFLPGALRGLSIYANATFLKTEGDYDGDGVMDNVSLVSFVPRTINAGVKWSYRGFIVSVDGRSQGSYYIGASDIPAARSFTFTRTSFDFNVSYQFSRSLTVYMLIPNFTNVQTRRYQYERDRVWQVVEPGPTITFGVRGWF